MERHEEMKTGITLQQKLPFSFVWRAVFVPQASLAILELPSEISAAHIVGVILTAVATLQGGVRWPENKPLNS